MDLPAIGIPPVHLTADDVEETRLRALPRIRRAISTAQESMRWIVSPPWHSFCDLNVVLLP